MPGFSKETATNVEHHGPVEERRQDIEGYAVQFLSFGQDIDATPMMKGLPGDHCSCPHWGYVFKGKATFRFADHEETFGPGDAFYLPAGHVPVMAAGTEYVQFSPSEPLSRVSSALIKNFEAMMQGAS